jgi:hypothetical protein
LTAYLITMVVINGNICIAEIYHPTCKINANWVTILERLASHYCTIRNIILIISPGRLVRVSHIVGPRWPSLTAPSYW